MIKVAGIFMMIIVSNGSHLDVSYIQNENWKTIDDCKLLSDKMNEERSFSLFFVSKCFE